MRNFGLLSLDIARAAALARIAELNPLLNAFTDVTDPAFC